MGMKRVLKKSLQKLKEKERKRLALDNQKTDHSGFTGLFETIIRRYKTLSHALSTLPLYVMGVVCMAAALTPSFYLYQIIMAAVAEHSALIRAAAMATAFATGYFIYGASLVVLVPVVNFVLRTNLRPWRGAYFSFGSLRWYIHNSLTYLVRYTFLDFITPTPFNLMYFRAMGMKVGVDVQLNTSNISDPSLIEIGDRATIGGSATLIAHYASSGFLIITPTKIGKGATIGLKATIMGGVEVGEYAVVMPNSVVLPKTIIPAGEIWGGVPAARMDAQRRNAA
jgi:acetyltransferase-like isoleucine patch superfamily enzyme